MHLILCNALMVGASVCILTFICITFSPSASASACIVIFICQIKTSYEIPFSRHALLHNLKYFSFRKTIFSNKSQQIDSHTCYHRNSAQCTNRKFVAVQFLFTHDIFVLIQSTSVKC